VAAAPLRIPVVFSGSQHSGATDHLDSEGIIQTRMVPGSKADGIIHVGRKCDLGSEMSGFGSSFRPAT
jgi:hypothetical protein